MSMRAKPAKFVEQRVAGHAELECRVSLVPTTALHHREYNAAFFIGGPIEGVASARLGIGTG